MRALIQRVRRASVVVDEKKISEIGPGLLTLLGVAQGDGEAELRWLIAKILNLRIFEDEAGKMNVSLLDRARAGGLAGHAASHLIVSQFTLFADARKGNRPSFLEAAKPEEARALYERALALSGELGVPAVGGQFQAHMNVELVNHGPVTIWLDSTARGS